MEGFARFMDMLPIWVIMPLLLLALVAAREVGGRLHRRYATRHDDAEDEAGDKGMLVSAVLGLLALLIAFTFSLALNRYDERRKIVVEEANDIGTAEMRVRLLPAPHDAELARLLQDYARTRLAYGQATAAEKPALAARSSSQRSAIQRAALIALAPEAHTPIAVLVTPAINSVLDIGVEREALNSARIPGTILSILIAYNLLTATVLGFALTGTRARQRSTTVVLFASLTLTLGMILDLDRPQRGTIRVDQTPMRQLVDGFAPLPAGVPQASAR